MRESERVVVQAADGGGLVGDSTVWRAVLERLPALAMSERPVLWVGETGTGKVRLAGALHRASSRHSRGFERFACGHPADEARLVERLAPRRVARTSRDPEPPQGTVLLVGLEDASPGLQCALATWCTAEPAGPQQPRLVVTARRALEPLVHARVLRPEVYHRLAGFQVVVPALRERGADVLTLARHFLRGAAQRHGMAPPELAPGVCERLRSHAWPGNVRELELACAWVIDVRGVRGRIESADWPDPRLGSPPKRELGLHAETHELEALRLREALARTHGNKSRAARALGLSRQGFLQKLRRHGLGSPLTLDAGQCAD